MNLISLYPEFYSTRSKFRINADGSVSPRDEDPNAPKPEEVSFTSILFGKKGSVSYSKDRVGITLGQDEFLSVDPESCKVKKASRPYASVSTRFCSKFESEFVPLAEKAMRENRPDTPQKQCEFQGGTWRDETCRCQRSTWAPALRIQDFSSETCFSIRVKTYMELAHEKSYELGGTVDPTAKAIKDARELCRQYFAQSVAPAKDAGSARGAR